MKIDRRIGSKIGIALLILLFALAGPLPLAAEDGGGSNRHAAELFAVLPDGASGPEGLAVGPDGNVYVATFGFNAAGAVTGLGQLYVFNRDGKLIRNVSVQSSSSHLLGIAFHPQTGALLVNDFGGGQVLRVDPITGASSVFMTVTGSSGLNGLTFDSRATCMYRTPLKELSGKPARMAAREPHG
jgi:sugar lactone lactonase YvrE